MHARAHAAHACCLSYTISLHPIYLMCRLNEPKRTPAYHIEMLASSMQGRRHVRTWALHIPILSFEDYNIVPGHNRQ